MLVRDLEGREEGIRRDLEREGEGGRDLDGSVGRNIARMDVIEG